MNFGVYGGLPPAGMSMSATVKGIFGVIENHFELGARLRAHRFDGAHPLSQIFRTVLCVDRLTVHHPTYERLGAELLVDVVIVCRDCHNEIHRRRRVPSGPGPVG